MERATLAAPATIRSSWSTSSATWSAARFVPATCIAPIAGSNSSLETLRAQGKSLAQVADALNANGHRTQNGALLTTVQVKRVLDRAKEE